MERRVLITGANGQLGLAINQVIQERKDLNITMINTDVGEATAYCPITLDITNPVAVMNLVQNIKPEIIINCAAFTAVDLCESEKERAYRINAIGAKNLAIAANDFDAKFVQVSTDYVFDGEGKMPYTEKDVPNPQSVYGSTKLEGEKFVQDICAKYFIVRTAWLYGDGKNFVKTMIRLMEEHKDIRVVNDQYGSPTSAMELAKAIVRLMDTEEYGIYHGVCDGGTNWYEFAKEIFKQLGSNVKVTPIETSEYPTPAKRPTYSILNNNKLKELGIHLKPWREALQEYILDEGNVRF